MRKYGFKLFSSNIHTAPDLVPECADFATKNPDVFIELMVVVDTPKTDLQKIKEQLGKVEVRIHAPHNTMGFDAGNKNLEEQNSKILSLSQYAADIFDAKTIVVHAGCGYGEEYIKETARQFKLFNDKRIVVENLPLIASDGVLLHGNTADEIKYIMNECSCGFCFDFSHAICAALTLGVDVEKHLRNFYDLHPSVYHICDGFMDKSEDLHLHLGEGDYPLHHFLQELTDENAYITMETGKGVMQHNTLWIKDYNYIKTKLLTK